MTIKEAYNLLSNEEYSTDQFYLRFEKPKNEEMKSAKMVVTRIDDSPENEPLHFNYSISLEKIEGDEINIINLYQQTSESIQDPNIKPKFIQYSNDPVVKRDGDVLHIPFNNRNTFFGSQIVGIISK